jgi:hypothetical protein
MTFRPRNRACWSIPRECPSERRHPMARNPLTPFGSGFGTPGEATPSSRSIAR